MTQTDRLNKIRLWASERGIKLFRNQVGSYELADGRHIRSGLAVGSGDLIGWCVLTIRPEMVGQKIAQFLSVEDKSEGDSPTEQQLRWRDAVRKDGGIAVIVTSIKELEEIL